MIIRITKILFYISRGLMDITSDFGAKGRTFESWLENSIFFISPFSKKYVQKVLSKVLRTTKTYYKKVLFINSKVLRTSYYVLQQNESTSYFVLRTFEKYKVLRTSYCTKYVSIVLLIVLVLRTIVRSTIALAEL